MPRGVYKRKPFTQEHRDAISRANRGDKHPRWVQSPTGNQKNTLIRRIVRKYGRAWRCESSCCDGKSNQYGWFNVSGDYKSDGSDWMMLCQSCGKYHHPLEDRVAEMHGKPSVCDCCGFKSEERYYRWLNKYRTGCDLFDRANWQRLCNVCYPVTRRNDSRSRFFQTLSEMLK